MSENSFNFLLTHYNKDSSFPHLKVHLFQIPSRKGQSFSACEALLSPFDYLSYLTVFPAQSSDTRKKKHQKRHKQNHKNDVSLVFNFICMPVPICYPLLSKQSIYL